MVENAHKALEHFHDENDRDPDSRERSEAIIHAAQGGGRPVSFIGRHHGELRPSLLARSEGGRLAEKRNSISGVCLPRGDGRSRGPA
jgi:hypothetical protein